MQIIRSKSNIVEKIIRDKEGKLVRARFAVYESHGRIKARLVDFVYLEETNLNNKPVFTLPGFNKDQTFWTEIFEKGYVSPFVNKGILNFSGSKPRAPTFI